MLLLLLLLLRAGQFERPRLGERQPTHLVDVAGCLLEHIGLIGQVDVMIWLVFVLLVHCTGGHHLVRKKVETCQGLLLVWSKANEDMIAIEYRATCLRREADHNVAKLQPKTCLDGGSC